VADRIPDPRLPDSGSRIPLVVASVALATIAFWAYTQTLLPGVDLGDTGGFQAAVLWPEVSARQAYPLYYGLARPFVSAVSAINPARGFVATANEVNLPEGFPIQDRRLGFEWAEHSRTRRIHEVLDEELRTLREVLTAEQWSRLPEAVRVPLRQLVPPRRFGKR